MKKEAFIEEDYKKYWIQDNATSVPFRVGTLRPHPVLSVSPAQVVSNCSVMSFLFWQEKPLNELCPDVFSAKILGPHLGHSSFWNPQMSFSFPHCQQMASLVAARARSTLPGVPLAAGLPERSSLSTGSRPSWRRLCPTFICAALAASPPKALRII